MKKPKPHRKPGAAAKPGPVHPAGMVPGGPMVPPGRTPPPAKPAPKKPAPRKPVPLHHGAPPPGILHRGAAPPVKTKSKKKPRALSDGVPCVAAAAAACLRLPVAAVLPFCSGDPDGDLIGDVLEALARHGLLSAYEEVMPYDPVSDSSCRRCASQPETRAGLILGVDLPGPHAVLALDGDWVTWGERRSPDEFPDAVTEEAWAVW